MTAPQIFIIGYMGSGKTTVASALARLLNSNAVDLDALITESARRSPKEIIEQAGEDKFREMETEMLRKVLDEGSARVIAAGGGAWTINANRELIAQHDAVSVWLDAPFELCWKRIEASGKTRPLAESRALAQTLYNARRRIYELADTQILVRENQSVKETAKEVADAVLRYSGNSRAKLLRQKDSR